jgi:hypothetical protein
MWSVIIFAGIFAECQIFLLNICCIEFFGDTFADNLLNPDFAERAGFLLPSSRTT